MTRFVNRQLNTLGALLFCALAGVLLQGCGAERTTPFDPDNSSSSSSSTASSVAASLITQGTSTVTTIDYKEKSLNVMRDSTEFFNFVDKYTNENPEAPNFDNGQVVLVDMGDTNGCNRHLNFNSFRAQEDGDSAVKVVVKYDEVSENRSGCSSTLTRPFYFYYVKSRGPLVFEEDIN